MMAVTNIHVTGLIEHQVFISSNFVNSVRLCGCTYIGHQQGIPHFEGNVE